MQVQALEKQQTQQRARRAAPRQRRLRDDLLPDPPSSLFVPLSAAAVSAADRYARSTASLDLAASHVRDAESSRGGGRGRQVNSSFEKPNDKCTPAPTQTPPSAARCA